MMHSDGVWVPTLCIVRLDEISLTSNEEKNTLRLI
jgi:hypothetical protein